MSSIAEDPKIPSKNCTKIIGIAEGSENDEKTTWELQTRFRDGPNILGLVAGSLVFGTAIAVVGERAKLVLDFVVAFSEIIMVLLNYY